MVFVVISTLSLYKVVINQSIEPSDKAKPAFGPAAKQRRAPGWGLSEPPHPSLLSSVRLMSQHTRSFIVGAFEANSNDLPSWGH